MPQAQPQYLDDNGNPIGAPDAAPALTYLDDQGNPIGAMKPQSVADQARQRLAARGLTPEAVKAGQGVTPDNFTTMGELQDPKNFPTTKEVLSSVGTHALNVAKALIPHVPHDAIDAATWMDPTGASGHVVDSIRGMPDVYQREIAHGNTPLSAGARAATESFVPGGSTMVGLTAPGAAAAQNRPVSKDENLAASGAVGDLAGAAALLGVSHGITSKMLDAPTSPTPSLNALEANLGSDIGTPAKPPYDTTKHGDIVNRAIGRGASDGKRGLNVGKAFVDAGEVIDPAEVKKNPRALIAHTNKVIAIENSAADQLLSSPEAQQPIANGRVLTRDVGANVAIVDAADARAAKAVKTYVDRRINELSAAHGGDGMLSVADTDTLKRELQNRANYDKIFGNTSTTSAGNLRNQLLADYARSLDAVGDTIPGYRELNDRRASLVNFRDKVLHPIVDAKIDGTSARPGRVAAAGRAVAGELIRANPVGATARGVGELIAPREVVPDPARIAKAINQQVNAAKSAGAPFPAKVIIGGAPVTQPLASDAPPLGPSGITPPAQFAASSDGNVFPIDQRPGQVPASFGSTGTTAGRDWAPQESPDVAEASRNATEATANAIRNPGFDPARLSGSASGPAPVAPPVSHVDLADTLRGVSSSPRDLTATPFDNAKFARPNEAAMPPSGVHDFTSLMHSPDAMTGSQLADTLRSGAPNPQRALPPASGPNVLPSSGVRYVDNNGTIVPDNVQSLVDQAGRAQSLADSIRSAAANRPAGVSAPSLAPLPEDLQSALDAQRGRDAETAARRAALPAAPETSAAEANQALIDMERRSATQRVYDKHIRVGLDDIDGDPGERYRIDELFDKNSKPSDLAAGKAIYDGYAKTRELLKAKYGDTIPLVRYEDPNAPKLEDKTVLHWYDPAQDTDAAAMAKMPGLVARVEDVPIEDIVAAPYYGKNKMREYLVANRESPALAIPGVKKK